MSEKLERILLIGNGPSADSFAIRAWREIGGLVFRVNHWAMNGGGSIGPRCDHWMVGEHPEAWLPVVAAKTLSDEKITIWAPGIHADKCAHIQKQIHPWPLMIQRLHQDMPAACRWEGDLRPRRPLNGSLALAACVAMQPKELWITGLDLYQHKSGKEYTAETIPPDHHLDHAELYRRNMLPNHNLISDLRYIRKALHAYRGEVISICSVMKERFGKDFPQWKWFDD